MMQHVDTLPCRRGQLLGCVYRSGTTSQVHLVVMYRTMFIIIIVLVIMHRCILYSNMALWYCYIVV